MRHRIEPGWRYSAAQFCLRLLFGRKWHFISPWPQAGVGVGVLLFYQDKTLLHLRRGAIEHVGKWGCNAGYLDFLKRETFTQGLAREVWEETGLRFTPDSFGEPVWTTIVYGQSKNEMAHHNTVGVWYAVQAPEDILPLVQESDEAHAFTWFSEAEVDAMAHQQKLSSPETYEAIKRGFAAAKAGPLPKLSWL